MARYRPQRQARVFACVAACVLLVGGLGPLVALLVSATLAALAGRLAYACTHPDDRRAQEHNRAAPAAHERALGLWSLLVYCSRCDGCYLPSGPIIPVDQMHAALYA